MSDIETERRKPGRPSNVEIAARAEQPSRVEEVQQRRRRREGMGPERNLKLAVPDKDPNYEYRWVNNRPGRVHQLTKNDDWDVAPEQNGPGLGTIGERTVDKTTGEQAILLRKPKEFYDEDQREKEKLLKSRDDAMRRGPPTAPADGDGDDKTYVPGGRNIVNGR